MRILFVRDDRYPPELYAGTELTTHWLCRHLVAHGHQAGVAVRSAAGGPAFLARDSLCGYPVFRAPSVIDAAKAATAAMQPQVFVLVQPNAWTDAMPPVVGRTPLILYVHSQDTGLHSMPEELLARAAILANSPSTSARILQKYGAGSIVVPPLFGIDRYAEIECSGQTVLFVSLQRRKGADVALAIARARPHIPFVFVESWTENGVQTEVYRAVVRGLPNVTLLPNQPDIGNILARTKLLLMPSRSREAWGRMATEAQICGIPVLGSSRGNLPATIGSGGLTLDPDDPIDSWLEAFDRIMETASVHERLSRNARAHGRAIANQAAHAYETFEEALRSVTAPSLPDAALVRRPVEKLSRRSVSWADVRTAVRLMGSLPVAWLFPERTWPFVARHSSGLAGILAGKSTRKVEARVARALRDGHRPSATPIAAALRGARYEVAFQCLCGYRPGGWRPKIAMLGREHLDEALRAGHGCILWVAHFVFATNVVKLGLHALGYRVSHISRPDHGFSSTTFGIRFLNPVRTKFENAHLAQRISFRRAHPAASMRRACEVLSKNGIVSLTAGAWEGSTIVEARMLGGRMPLAVGPIWLARKTGAALLPVFAIRTGHGRFIVEIDQPIDVRRHADEAGSMIEAARIFAARHTARIRRHPAQWRGWSSMRDDAESAPPPAHEPRVMAAAAATAGAGTCHAPLPASGDPPSNMHANSRD